jgi:hypothetical protein
MNRNVGAAIAASILVIGAVVLGFVVLGSPGNQRLVQSDRRRVQMLAQLAQQINNSWNTSGKVLPSSLEKFADVAKLDPVTHKSYVYKPKTETKYELCATFVKDSPETPNNDPNMSWNHPKGDYCFQFDATQPVPNAPYYY